MAKIKPDINSGLSWLERILQLCKEYGVFNILKGLFILIILSLTLSNGLLDWQHGTMRFDLCNDDVESIKNQYNDFNLIWINLPDYLKENEVFLGDMVKLDSIDSTLYTQLKKNDVQYLACTIIKDSSGYPIGILGIIWKNIPPNIDSLQNKIHNYLIDDRADIKTLLQSNYNKE